MPRFFVPPEAVLAEHCRITGADAVHLARSLRIRRGERLLVVTGETEHGVEVTTVHPGTVEGRVLWSRPAQGATRLHIEVLQAIPRSGVDEAIENLTEIGAAVIRPVTTERTVVRPDAGRPHRRTERWRSIATNAAGLSFRSAPPRVHDPATLDEALRSLPQPHRLLVCALELSTVPLTTLRLAPGQPIALAVGPEGGWGEHDLALLTQAGAEFVHLGPRVLRVRLAGAVALSLLLAAAGELTAAYAAPPDSVTGAPGP
ncbi:MAG: 16S rRNA (uracil(1498)-N(3))-methyltransferase [Candidatus Dormibacteria bacterium]